MSSLTQLRPTERRRVIDLVRDAGIDVSDWANHEGGAARAALETHHVVPLSENGPDSIRNVVALCPNHHREAHFGSLRATMRALLLDFLRLPAPGAPAV